MLYPMFFMVMLTFVILLFTLRIRLASVRRGEVSLSYYSMFQGEEIPDLVIKTSRNVANLFEVPVLFYAAGVLYVALEMSDPVPVTLAWVFVTARVIHTGIHLSYNNVMHRLIVFGLGNLSVLGMWISIVSSTASA
ncbi:MAG: MAPEG family protein [Pseudohongiellaceae bacterium]